MPKKNIASVVKYLSEHTWSATAKHFNISEMTISRYLKRFNQTNIINDEQYTKLLKAGFNRILKKKLFDMKAVELRVVYYLLTGVSKSLKRDQYIIKIKNIAGVNHFRTMG